MMFLVCKTMQLHETASTLEQGIWGHLDLCSGAMVTQNWLQNKLSIIPLKMIAVVLCWQTCPSNVRKKDNSFTFMGDMAQVLLHLGELGWGFRTIWVRLLFAQVQCWQIRIGRVQPHWARKWFRNLKWEQRRRFLLRPEPPWLELTKDAS